MVSTLKGVLACAAGHHFRVARDAPGKMMAINADCADESSAREADGTEANEPMPDGEIFPMAEVCPHPDYFADQPAKKPVV